MTTEHAPCPNAGKHERNESLHFCYSYPGDERMYSVYCMCGVSGPRAYSEANAWAAWDDIMGARATNEELRKTFVDGALWMYGLRKQLSWPDDLLGPTVAEAHRRWPEEVSGD